MNFNLDFTKRHSISPGADGVSMSPQPWCYDGEFGIVHSCGCAICRNYMLHVSAEAEDDSYAQAISERNAELRNRFFEGFRRGRAAQLEHDMERLNTCRSQRDVAREQISVHKSKAEEAEKEIIRLRDELMVLRIAYHEGPEVVSVNSNSTSSDEGSSLSDTDDSDDEHRGYGRLSDGIWEGESTAVDDDAVEDDDTTEPPSPCLCPSTEFSYHPSVLPPTTVDDDEGEERETKKKSLFRPVFGSVGSSPHSPSSSPEPSPTASAVDEIRRKMKLAHLPGQGEILAEIRSIISQAHKIHHSQRTEVQKVLMLEWRRPPAAFTYIPSIPAPVATPMPIPVSTPSEPEEINVYVDASGTGIGFYFLGRWQAWRLKDGWRSPKLRDIQWAEAVAIEMSIRLLLEAGYAGTKIRLHSDNQQVVDAFSTQDFNRAEVGHVVQLYAILSRSNGLDCTIKWIPGVENPADAPSRFLSLDKNKRFPSDVTIPPHLQEFILPYHFPE